MAGIGSALVGRNTIKYKSVVTNYAQRGLDLNDHDEGSDLDFGENNNDGGYQQGYGDDLVQDQNGGSASESNRITGIPKHAVVSYSLFGTAVWANIVNAGFKAVESIQPTVSTWAKGSRVFGHGTNVLSGISIGYDFATGTANTSTMVNFGVTTISYGVIGIVGTAAIPYVVGAGIIYGVWSIAGGDKWLNNTWDNSHINIVKPYNKQI